MKEEEIEYKMELIHLLLNGMVPKEKWNTVLDYISKESEWVEILLMEILLRQVGEEERERKKNWN